MMAKQRQLITESVEDKQQDLKGNLQFFLVTEHTRNSSALESGCTPKFFYSKEGTMTETLEHCY